jgi:2-polyprenyl-6-methoxyphenol hydroxylase-like FAD-dependent oxidoreductase
MKTLLLEAAPRGTNHALSTHFIQPPGVEALDRIGLGDAVRRAAPATQRLRFSLDDAVAVSSFTEGRAGRCVRRSTIDPLLQDAAEAAGATFRDRQKVTALVKDGERVTGVVVEGPDGPETLLANLVVGADGSNSTVARLAGAEEYLGDDASRGGYFFYFPAPAKWEHDWDAALEHRGDDVRYVFRCDGDLVLLVAATPVADCSTWGKDWRARTLSKLRESPITGPLVEGKEPVGKGCGLLQAHYFYRRPVGPGFALVGDAGHFKDFVTGQGMTDAFLDAERLAAAVVDGREAAFMHYWRERDVATLPLHFDAIQQGAVGFNSPLMRWVIDNVSRRPDLIDRPAQVASREIMPDQIVPMRTMLGFMGKALLRGRFDVLSGFMAMGKTTSAEQKELAARTLQLEEARKLLADAPAPTLQSIRATPAFNDSMPAAGVPLSTRAHGALS